LPHALTPYEVAVAMGLRESNNRIPARTSYSMNSYNHHEFPDVSAYLQGRYWCIQPSVATTGEGLYEGFDWVANAIQATQNVVF